MSKEEDTTDALAQFIVDEKVRGRSFVEIAHKHNIPVEEVITIYREYIAAVAIRDPLEHRMLLQLRTEKIIDQLWDGLEQGSFKHGEAILKAVNTLQELHNLNEQAITTQVNVMVDEDAGKVFEVLKHANRAMLERVLQLPLNKKAREELAAWPEWAAETSTAAIEDVIYAEIVEED